MKLDIIEESKILVTAEDRLDLLLIYYMLERKISRLVTRIYWQDKNISQNKTIRLGRKPVTIILEPDDLRFNYNMKRLRVTGRVVEASPEEGVKGRKLGVDINIGQEIYIDYRQKTLDILRLAEEHEYKQLIIVVIDSGGIALARVSDTITVLEEMYIPSSKFFNIHLDVLNSAVEKIFEKISDLKRREKELLVIAAVNTFTEKLVNRYKKTVDFIVEGGFSGTYTGIIQALRSDELKKRKIDNPVLNNIDTYESLFKSVYSDRLIYGIDNIKTAIINRGITTLYINYQVILEKPELIEYIVTGLRKHIKTVITDKRDFLGVALERFGGVVGIY